LKRARNPRSSKVAEISWIIFGLADRYIPKPFDVDILRVQTSARLFGVVVLRTDGSGGRGCSNGPLSQKRTSAPIAGCCWPITPSKCHKRRKSAGTFNLTDRSKLSHREDRECRNPPQSRHRSPPDGPAPALFRLAQPIDPPLRS
jgi:hypothetical protein